MFHEPGGVFAPEVVEPHVREVGREVNAAHAGARRPMRGRGAWLWPSDSTILICI